MGGAGAAAAATEAVMHTAPMIAPHASSFPDTPNMPLNFMVFPFESTFVRTPDLTEA